MMVLMNYNTWPTRPGHHTVHLHGHSFAVLALGFAPQNRSTGQIDLADGVMNDDIGCDSGLCAQSQLEQVKWNAPQDSSRSVLFFFVIGQTVPRDPSALPKSVSASELESAAQNLLH